MHSVITSMPSAGLPAIGLRRRLVQLRGAVWRALEVIGRARAQPHLLAFADRCEALQPGLAKELRAACRQGPMA